MKTKINPNLQRGTLLLPLIVLLVLITILALFVRAIIDGIWHLIPDRDDDEEGQRVPPGWFTANEGEPQPILVTNAVFSVLRSTTMAGWPDVSGWQVIGTVKGTNGAAPKFADPDLAFQQTNQCGFYVTRFEYLEITEEWP